MITVLEPATLETIVTKMIEWEECWKVTEHFAKVVMKEKIAE